MLTPTTEDKVALIQLACERKIALFHIALHDGQTSEELIAPSLRRIIESANILKAGVAVLNADFKRLENHFQLHPRGAFELSHLHHLITPGSHNPGKATFKLCALSAQVKHHLGLPLYKGSVRTSNWSLPLDDDQKIYAANDSYAGYMLFHCMNAKRLKMSPVPSLPRLAESYHASTHTLRASIEDIQLELNAKDVIVPARLSFAVQPTEGKVEYDGNKNLEVYSSHKASHSPVKEKVRSPKCSKVNTPPEPEISYKLFGQLVSHRKRLATTRNTPPYIIASNKVLKELAKYRPVNKMELLNIHGIGERKVREYGGEWLRIIAQDIAEHPKEGPQKARPPLEAMSSNRDAKTRRDVCRKPSDSAPYEELYKRLEEHRRAHAILQGQRQDRVATDTTLEELAEKRPSNAHELLLICGVSLTKVAEYGPEWLRIIAEFEAEYKSKALELSMPRGPTSPCPAGDAQLYPPQPQQLSSDQPSKRRRIRNVGRSKEILLPQCVPSTGLSFEFAETRLDADETSIGRDDGDNHDQADDSAAFGISMASPTSYQLKRKRNDLSDKHPQTSSPSLSSAPSLDPVRIPDTLPVKVEVTQPEPLSLEQRLLRKKLDAYVKSVVFLMNPKPCQPIVSGDTLDCLVTTLPPTLDEFRQVPGIQEFFRACNGVKKDLWLTFSTWTRTAGLSQSSQTR